MDENQLIPIISVNIADILKKQMKKPDSIIFDMDGTLWDPMELYTEAWNKGLKAAGIEKTLKTDELKPLMGVEGKKVLSTLLPGYTEEQHKEVYESVNIQRRELIKEKKGTIFEGMKEGLKQLSEKYKLFIVSNCPEGLILLFMERAGISSYITDEMAYGVNYMPKYHNINLLVEKYNLQQPVYVGDTDIDREQSEKAGLPFIFFSFGFGQAERYELKFDDFQSFTRYFMSL